MILVTGKPFQKGFSLLEIMVVIVIIGGIASLVVVNFSYSPHSSELDSSYQKFRIQAQALSRKAMVEQRWFGLLFSENQYHAMVFNDQGWNRLASEENNWPPGLDVELVINGQTINLLSEAIVPQLHFSPEGLVTPFKMRLSDLNSSLELEDPYAQVD